MSEESEVQSPETSVAPKDPVKRILRISLGVLLFLFIWYLVADRIAPWTDQARVQAYVVPVVPNVSGRVIEVNVSQNEEVQPGDILFRIDPSDFELAVEDAASALELAGQEIGAGTATVTTAQAKLAEAMTQLEYVNTQSVRVFELEKKQVLSKAEGDKARALVEQTKAQLDSARAELDKAKQSLGKSGQENPRIRSAIAALAKAQLDLSRTKIVAPSHGGITNLQVDVGHFASAGQPVMTFIGVDDVWIQANLRENSIANIKQGDAVEIALDVAPGKIFTGTVGSIGFAADAGSTGAIGDLATIEGKTGWLRDAQRFPVFITFDDDSARGYRRLGGQADVQIYTSNNWFVNPLGWIWIRLMSWLSFIY